MKRYFLLSLFFFLALGLLGVGCSNQEASPQPGENPQSTTTTTEPQVVSTTPLQQAQLFCFAQGYSTTFHYTQAHDRVELYCEFSNGSECIAAEFMQGICSPQEAEENTIPLVEGSLESSTSFRACMTEIKPVCGENNKTYTNPCIAEISGIRIAHEGVCDIPLLERTPRSDTIDTLSPGAQQPSSPPPLITQPTTGSPPRSGQLDWLEIAIDVLKQNTNTRSHIEQCVVNGSTYYYSVEDCPDCFDALYNTEGSIICYPKRDVAGLCPSGFSSQNLSKHCSTIWRSN